MNIKHRWASYHLILPWISWLGPFDRIWFCKISCVAELACHAVPKYTVPGSVCTPPLNSSPFFFTFNTPFMSFIRFLTLRSIPFEHICPPHTEKTCREMGFPNSTQPGVSSKWGSAGGAPASHFQASHASAAMVEVRDLNKWRVLCLGQVVSQCQCVSRCQCQHGIPLKPSERWDQSDRRGVWLSVSSKSVSDTIAVGIKVFFVQVFSMLMLVSA